MTKRRTALLGTTIIGVAAIAGARGAMAQPISGLYVGAGVGYSLLGHEAGTVDATVAFVTPQKVPTTAAFKGGIGGVGSVGYGVGNGLRIEIEGSARSNQQKPNSATFTTNGSTTPTTVSASTGTENKFGVMVNVLYDADVGLSWLYPYVGVGAGYQFVEWSNVGVLASGVSFFTGPSSVTANQTLGKPAYQAILGGSFPIEQVAGLSLTAEYRFMGITGSRAYTSVATFQFGTPATTHVRETSDYSHTFLVGLRYAFDVNPAEPQPGPAAPVPQGYAPAQAAVRTYIVFFDFDSAELTQRARDIIADAVRASARIQHTRIEVSGNADRSGTPAYNQALSMRRAEVVAAEMARWGVPRAIMDIHAYGDSRPLVPTAAGVREPQNRRVEITYR
jgi:outer membrane protein OmpA-like peptidoglycan-associated protein